MPADAKNIELNRMCFPIYTDTLQNGFCINSKITHFKDGHVVYETWRTPVEGWLAFWKKVL
jgi:hypothetical protein